MGRPELSGITWAHPRGFDPLVACAQRFERETGIRVEWHVRSLQGFADASLHDLARQHDLVVFDHPHLGEVVEAGAFVPLNERVSHASLQDWAENSVGPSYDSYVMAGALWGAPVDAAGTVAAWRPALLAGEARDVPRTWSEVIELGAVLHGSGRFVATPLLPIDALTAFFTLIANAGAPLFETSSTVAPRHEARAALLRLAELASVSHPMSLRWSPIDVLEAMSTTDTVVYSPLLFGYSNYARPGFRQHLVEFGAFPSDHGSLAGGILGGAGLGVSASSRHVQEACEFVEFVCGGEVQRGAYFAAGGQPGHRSAWTDRETNRQTGGYFAATLATMDSQIVRPRHDGYLLVQDEGGHCVHEFLANGGDVDRVVDRLDAIAAASYRANPPT